MTKKEFFINMKVLLSAYNKDFNQEQLAVWYDFFKNDNIKEFGDAIARVVKTKDFFPSIAELKKEMANIRNENLQLDPENEWQEVLNAIHSFDIYDGEKAIATLKPFTQKIVRCLGWYRLCNSEDIKWDKKDFIRIFEDRLGRTSKLEQQRENLTYYEQILLEEQQIEKQELLELER